MFFFGSLAACFRAAFGLVAVATLLACASTPPKSTTPVRPAAASKAAVGTPTTTRSTGPTIKLIRPAQGTTLSVFNGTTSQGIDIAGQAGDSVVAAAEGRVVYIGKDVRGYGNMVIIKHNEVFLTAYAHNRSMLVNENDVVRQGQKIAEMGSTGSAVTKLHFELRRNGVAVNPLPYLDGAAAR